MTLDAWCNNGIWTWTSLYILKHKNEYLNCKRTKNNHEKAVFYGSLYQAYQNTPGHCYRSSRSLRDLISDRSKLCRYVYELDDMKEGGVDLTWVSPDILARLDELKQILPVPKRRKRKRKAAGRGQLTDPRRHQARRTNISITNVSTSMKLCSPPAVSPAAIHPTTTPPRFPHPGMVKLLGSKPQQPPNASSWGLWLNFQLEQSVELQSTGVRPQCYNFIVKLPAGQVLAVSEDSIMALGYDMTGQQFDTTRRVGGGAANGPSAQDIMAMSKSVIKQNMEFGCSKMPILYQRQIRDCADREYIWVEAYSKILERNEKEIIVCMRERNVTDAVLWGQRLATKQAVDESKSGAIKIENLGHAPRSVQQRNLPSRTEPSKSYLQVPNPADFPGNNSRSSSLGRSSNCSGSTHMESSMSAPDEPTTPIYVGDPKLQRFMLGENNHNSRDQRVRVTVEVGDRYQRPPNAPQHVPTLSDWNAVSLPAVPHAPAVQREVPPNIPSFLGASVPPFPTALPTTLRNQLAMKCGLTGPPQDKYPCQ